MKFNIISAKKHNVRWMFCIVLVCIICSGCGVTISNQDSPSAEYSITCAETGESVITYSDKYFTSTSDSVVITNYNDFDIEVIAILQDDSNISTDDCDFYEKIESGKCKGWDNVKKNKEYLIGVRAKVPEGTSIKFNIK